MVKRSKEVYLPIYLMKQDIFPQYGATKRRTFILNKENDENIVKYIGAIDDNHQDMKTVKITFYKTRLMLF
jgi:hypothetical protein